MASKLRGITAMTALGTALCAGSAMAAPNWPTSVVGTWTAFANQSHLQIAITSQGATGNCKQINGTLTDTDTGAFSVIEGFYCPFSGRISFLREDSRTKQTFQAYQGNLAVTGSQNYMGGTFQQEVPSGRLGEYEWYATVQPAGTAP